MCCKITDEMWGLQLFLILGRGMFAPAYRWPIRYSRFFLLCRDLVFVLVVIVAVPVPTHCLLSPSDAAGEGLVVDLGGRRISRQQK